MSAWREPAEESVDLYPGLVVDDDRVSGSITVGRSRLPLWAFVGMLPEGGWDAVLEGWDYIETEYGWDARRMAAFFTDLMEARGEFGRLLLVLADAERRESEREDEALEGHGGVVNVTPGDPDAVQLPPAWWEDPVLSAPVADQLRRCLAALPDEEVAR